MMEERSICVLAYNMATILSEKLETVIPVEIRILDQEISMIFTYLPNYRLKILIWKHWHLRWMQLPEAGVIKRCKTIS